MTTTNNQESIIISNQQNQHQENDNDQIITIDNNDNHNHNNTNYYHDDGTYDDDEEEEDDESSSFFLLPSYFSSSSSSSNSNNNSSFTTPLNDLTSSLFNRHVFNNMTRFQFSSPLSSLFSSPLSLTNNNNNLESNDDRHNNHNHNQQQNGGGGGENNVKIRLEQRQQMGGTQHVYYCPSSPSPPSVDATDAVESTTNNEQNVIDGCLVQIPLRHGEKLLYETKPPIQFSKNVLIMFVCATLVLSFIFWLPILYLRRKIVSSRDFSRLFSWFLWLLYWALILVYVFILVYALCFRLLYRKLCTVYAITNRRIIVIEGNEKWERLLMRLRSLLLRLEPKLARYIPLMNRLLFGLRRMNYYGVSGHGRGGGGGGRGRRSSFSNDGYSRLSMRDRYGTNVTFMHNDDDDDDDENAVDDGMTIDEGRNVQLSNQRDGDANSHVRLEMEMMNEPYLIGDESIASSGANGGNSGGSNVEQRDAIRGRIKSSHSLPADHDDNDDDDDSDRVRTSSSPSHYRYDMIDRSGYVTSWEFSEIGDLYFMLYHGFKHGSQFLQSSNSNNRGNDSSIAVNSQDCMGSVYFGYKIDAYTLPFTIVTHAVATGFLLVPNVYKVLDILIHQIQLHSPNALPQARLVRSKNDPAIRSHVISRTYAMCGLDVCFCCPENDVRGVSHRDRDETVIGKITQEDYRNLTVNYTLM